MPSRYVPTYESGIAIPPRLECVCGKNCSRIDAHHNAFDENYYKNPPGISSEKSLEAVKLFRGSRYNTFWVNRCRHEAIQPTGKERVKRPKLEVILGFLDESKILLNLDQTTEAITYNTKRLQSWPSHREKKSATELEERIFSLEERRKDLIPTVLTLEIIPEEVVTGALILSVPEVAQQRLMDNPVQGVVAPLSWPKFSVESMANDARSIISLQTGVDKVQLAA